MRGIFDEAHMRIIRWLVLGMAIGLLVSVAPSCGQAACGPTTCFGCCDATGLCVTGAEVSACGVSGAVCNACGAAQACQQGGCVFTNEGTPDAGTDGGSGVVDPTNPLALTVAISPNPPIQGDNTLTVMVKGANGVPVIGATLKASFMMPSMPGMGTGHATGVESGGGEYSIDKVKFTMGGGWRVTVDATQGALAGTQVMNYSL